MCVGGARGPHFVCICFIFWKMLNFFFISFPSFLEFGLSLLFLANIPPKDAPSLTSTTTTTSTKATKRRTFHFLFFSFSSRWLSNCLYLICKQFSFCVTEKSLFFIVSSGLADGELWVLGCALGAYTVYSFFFFQKKNISSKSIAKTNWILWWPSLSCYFFSIYIPCVVHWSVEFRPNHKCASEWVAHKKYCGNELLDGVFLDCCILHANEYKIERNICSCKTLESVFWKTTPPSPPWVRETKEYVRQQYDSSES